MPQFAQQLALFKNASFFNYFFNALLSTFASGLFYINTTWLMISTQGTVLSVALISICFWLPVVFCSPLMGVIADRYPKRSLLMVASFFRAAVILIFLLVFHWAPEIWEIYICVFLQGLALSLIFPVIFSIVREVVSEDALLYANATADMGYEIGNVLGMGLAGFFIYQIGVQGAFIVNIVCYLVAGFFAWRLPLSTFIHQGVKSVGQVIRDYHDSLIYVARRKELMAVYGIQLLIMAQFMTIPVLLAPFATHVLHATVGEFGAIEACLSGGVILGACITPGLAERFGRRLILSLGIIACIILYIIFMRIDQVWMAQVLFFLLGFSYTVWPIIMTRAQSLTALDFQGRVQSTFTVFASFSVLFVYWFLGVSGAFIPPNYLFIIQIVFSSMAFFMLYWVRF